MAVKPAAFPASTGNPFLKPSQKLIGGTFLKLFPNPYSVEVPVNCCFSSVLTVLDVNMAVISKGLRIHLLSCDIRRKHPLNFVSDPLRCSFVLAFTFSSGRS